MYTFFQSKPLMKLELSWPRYVSFSFSSSSTTKMRANWRFCFFVQNLYLIWKPYYKQFRWYKNKNLIPAGTKILTVVRVHALDIGEINSVHRWVQSSNWIFLLWGWSMARMLSAPDCRVVKLCDSNVFRETFTRYDSAKIMPQKRRGVDFATPSRGGSFRPQLAQD